MIMRLINKLKKYLKESRSQIKIYLLSKKNIYIGKNNILHMSVSLDTSLGGTIKLGTDNHILNGCLLMTYGGTINIGNNCSINPYTIIYGHGNGVLIGNNVLIAGHCMIIPANHNFSRVDIPINQQGTNSKGIIIEDDVWIGAGCKILDGVTIAKGTIIAAGSVVNKSTESFSIVAGVPARVIKRRK